VRVVPAARVQARVQPQARRAPPAFQQHSMVAWKAPPKMRARLGCYARTPARISIPTPTTAEAAALAALPPRPARKALVERAVIPVSRIVRVRASIWRRVRSIVADAASNVPRVFAAKAGFVRVSVKFAPAVVRTSHRIPLTVDRAGMPVLRRLLRRQADREVDPQHPHSSVRHQGALSIAIQALAYAVEPASTFKQTITIAVPAEQRARAARYV
jgi:hypothetical protein